LTWCGRRPWKRTGSRERGGIPGSRSPRRRGSRWPPLVAPISEGNHPGRSPIESPEGSEGLTRKGCSVKSLLASFHGPLARVAINTAGPVLVLYFLVTASAFTVAGIVWWAAGALALGPTLIVAGMAVVGFRTSGQALQPLRRLGRARRGRCRSEALRPLLVGDRRGAAELELTPDIGLAARASNLLPTTGTTK
jgi:hypothetical protein